MITVQGEDNGVDNKMRNKGCHFSLPKSVGKIGMDS